MNYVNLIPIMTSDENVDIKLSCSSFYTSSAGRGARQPFKCLDADYADGGWEFQNVKAPTDIGAHWMKIQFKKVPICINAIKLVNSPVVCSVKQFKIQASTNDIDYIDLYDGIHPYGEKDTRVMIYDFYNVLKFNYYRILIINSHHSSSLTYGGIGILEVYNTLTNSYLISFNDKYYSINTEFYPANSQMYSPLNITNLDKLSFDTMGFPDLLSLCNEISIGDETFKPIDKFDGNFNIFRCD